MKFFGLMVLFVALLAIAFTIGYKTEVDYEDDPSVSGNVIGAAGKQVGGVRMGSSSSLR